MTKGPNKKSKSKTLWLITYPCIAILLVLSTMPYIISTSIGKNTLLFFLNRSLPGTVSIDTLSFSWSGPQTMQQIQYKTHDNEFEASCSSLCIESPLFTLIFSSPHKVGTLKISKPFCRVQIPLSSSSFLSLKENHHTLAASMIPLIGKIEQLQKKISPFVGTIEIEDGSAEILTPDTPPLVIHSFAGSLCIEEKAKNISCHMHLDGEQDGEKGTLLVDGDLVSSDEFSLEASISASHFPCQGISPFFIGKTIDLSSEIALSLASCVVNLHIASDPLKASLEIVSDGKRASLKQVPASCEIDLSKFGLVPQSSPVILSCQIQELSIPLSQWQEGSFTATVTSSPCTVKENLVATIQGTLSSQKIQDKIEGHVQAFVRQGKVSSDFVADITVTDPLSPSYKITSSLSAKDFPLALAGLSSIEPYLGDTLSTNCFISGSMETADIQIDKIVTASLHVPQMHFRYKKNELSLEKIVTPITYKLESPSPAIVWAKKPSVSLTLHKLFIGNTLETSFSISIPEIACQKFFALEDYTITPLTITCDANALSSISIKAEGAGLSMASVWNLEKETQPYILSLVKPLKLSYAVEDTLLPLFLDGPHRPHLKKPALIEGSIDPTQLILEGNILEQLQIKAELNVKEIALDKQQLSLEKTSVSLAFNGKTHSTKLSLSTNLLASSQVEGSIFGTFSMQDNELQEANLNIEKISLPLIDSLNLVSLKTAPFLGNSLDASLLIKPAKQNSIITAKITSPLLEFQGSLILSPQSLQINSASPSSLEYTLTPDGYASLSTYFPSSPFFLQHPALFAVKVSQLLLPFDVTTKQPDFLHANILATFVNKEMLFGKKIEGEKSVSLSLHETKILLERKTQEADLLVKIDALASSGSLHIDGTIHPDKKKVLFLVKLSDLPTSMLDLTYPIQPSFFSALLGPSINFMADVQLQEGTGPFSCNLQSSTTACSFKGLVNTTAVTLIDPFKASISLSKEAGKLLLKAAKNPLSLRSFSTSTPISINISPQGFFWPIAEPFLMEKINIGSGSLNLGKISCENDGNMQQALKFLRSKSVNNKTLDVWFAPLDFAMHQNVVNIDRTEVLLDNTFDIAFWGNLNFLKQYVDMTIGLTASTLYQALGIKNLPRDYVMKIPLRGPFDAVEVSTGTASSKIAALMLWQSKALEKGLGPIGGLLKQVIPPPGGEGKTPSPKKPFPWEKR